MTQVRTQDGRGWTMQAFPAALLTAMFTAILLIHAAAAGAQNSNQSPDPSKDR